MGIFSDMAAAQRAAAAKAAQELRQKEARLDALDAEFRRQLSDVRNFLSSEVSAAHEINFPAKFEESALHDPIRRDFYFKLEREGHSGLHVLTRVSLDESEKFSITVLSEVFGDRYREVLAYDPIHANHPDLIESLNIALTDMVSEWRNPSR